ncbi:MAG: ATP-binding cassette domain-containing protein [Deltaproteobacteria bacterium]|jgi:iron complex transport system ATP-binding protein|nr:ATP-binding cassette domain-containing protein [Deltaproteobacteria bacterium]
MTCGPVIELKDIVFKRRGETLIDKLNWLVLPGQHWALIGPNGAGKTLLLRLVTGYLWPSDGEITILGHKLGEIDLRLLRKSIGWVSQALADLMPQNLPLNEVVLSGPKASLGLYEAAPKKDLERAQALLGQFGLINMQNRAFGLLSSGERQRALLVRAVMAKASLLILDEPMSNLDLGGRELFIKLVTSLASGPNSPTVVLTTHNISELGPFITHAAIIKKGRLVKAGLLEETITTKWLSQAFDLPLCVEKTPNGRYLAYLK